MTFLPYVNVLCLTKVWSSAVFKSQVFALIWNGLQLFGWPPGSSLQAGCLKGQVGVILYPLDKNFSLGRWSQKERFAKQRKGYTQNCRQLKEHGLLRESRKVRCSLKEWQEGTWVWRSMWRPDCGKYMDGPCWGDWTWSVDKSEPMANLNNPA